MRAHDRRLKGKAILVTSAGNGVGYGMVESAGEQRASKLHPPRWRFIRIQGRDVHYVRAGEGPPVVLLHSAIVSARSQLRLLKRLSSDHTVFAFDNPGFGDSDPLLKRNLRIADAAEALRLTLLALKIPRCPVYGAHTGGAVAIELACRYPEQVSAVIVDGANVFNPRETKLLLTDDYRPLIPVKDDGSHLLANWMKTRDARIWFPWYKRTAKNRQSAPFPSLESLHNGYIDLLRAGNGYQALYGAVFKHNFCEGMETLTVPITVMAMAHDILFPHLDRLPKLKPNQHIGRYPAGVDYDDEKAKVVRSYRVQANAPPDAPFRPTSGSINRRYVDLPGGQILVRSAGEAHSGRPLLLLHDGRASSRMFEPFMRALLTHRIAVYALDIPDNGASDSLATRRPSIEEYADAVAGAVAALRLGSCDIYAVGAGAAVALSLLTRPAFAKGNILFEAPDFYSESFARHLARDWAPPLVPQWDGAHLIQLWLMLRDEYAFWPWFDKSPAAACAVDTPTDWHEMHARVVDILRSLPTYHRLTAAALRYDWLAALRRLRKRAVRWATTATDPRRPHVEAAAELTHLPEVASLPVAEDAKAGEILRLLRRT